MMSYKLMQPTVNVSIHIDTADLIQHLWDKVKSLSPLYLVNVVKSERNYAWLLLLAGHCVRLALYSLHMLWWWMSSSSISEYVVAQDRGDTLPSFRRDSCTWGYLDWHSSNFPSNKDSGPLLYSITKSSRSNYSPNTLVVTVIPTGSGRLSKETFLIEYNINLNDIAQEL